MGRKKGRDISGWLVVDKPAGVTSTAVVGKVRWAFDAKKAGHAGTLDPMATGLLVVMVGKSTRLCNALMAHRKQYETTIDLSHTSTTDDAEGTLTQVAVSAPPSLEQVRAILPRFTGEIDQVPPAFSAIHVGGQRAYHLAREGKAPQLASRKVLVHAIELLHYEWPTLTLRIDCGKGTYIRSLARDIGTTLNTGGMLTELRRTQSGDYSISQARTLVTLPDAMTQCDLLPEPTVY